MTNYFQEPDAKTLLGRLKLGSHKKDFATFVSLLEPNPDALLLDVGCGSGIRTRSYIERIKPKWVVGIDAKNWGVPFKFVEQDIDNGIPFVEDQFDVVTAHHVIEHVSNTDLFVKEIHRVLKPGGYTIIGTPNLASGRVILELLIDRQPGIAYVSDYLRIRGGIGENWKKSEGRLHRRLFISEGLEKLLLHYGFYIEKSLKTGYGPLFFLSGFLRGLYAGNLIVKARKT